MADKQTFKATVEKYPNMDSARFESKVRSTVVRINFTGPEVITL